MSRRFLILLLTALVANTPFCYGSIDDILKDIFTSNGAENASSSITTMEPPTALSSSDLKGTMTGECVGENKQISFVRNENAVCRRSSDVVPKLFFPLITQSIN